MRQRQLTGNWYLKKLTFWGGYKVMVEVKSSKWGDPTYGNGGGSYSPETISYEEAQDRDLIDLDIKCV